MSADDSRGTLARAIKDLNTRWLETRGSWDDAISREFEQAHLEPLQLDVRSAMSAIDQIAKLLNQVKRDCT